MAEAADSALALLGDLSTVCPIHLHPRLQEFLNVAAKQLDSFLQLTCPSCAVVFADAADFEVQLHVKGRTEYDDKTLSFGDFRYKESTTTVVCRHYTNKLSTLEFTFALLRKAVEATICSVKVVKGSWPDHFRKLIVSRTASIAKEDILLDSHHAGTMPIYSDDGGEIKLSRRLSQYSQKYVRWELLSLGPCFLNKLVSLCYY